MTLTLGHYLSLGAMLFALAAIGIFLNRKNLIVLLMAIELMLLAVNMPLHDPHVGQAAFSSAPSSSADISPMLCCATP